MDIHQELKELSKFLSEYSTSLMAVGVQTSRIVRNTARIIRVPLRYDDLSENDHYDIA